MEVVHDDYDEPDGDEPDGNDEVGTDEVDGQVEPSDDITGELLEQSEGLDDDDLTERSGVDPGDDVYDPPEGWSEADRFGTTLAEAEEGESLDEKLGAEVPDVGE